MSNTDSPMTDAPAATQAPPARPLTQAELETLACAVSIGGDDHIRIPCVTVARLVRELFALRTPVAAPRGGAGGEGRESRIERDLRQLIAERDAAEETLSEAYYLVTGRVAEWSNNFGHRQALDDIVEALPTAPAPPSEPSPGREGEAPAETTPTSWQCPKCRRWQSTAWDRCRSEYDTGVSCDGVRAAPAATPGKRAAPPQRPASTTSSQSGTTADAGALAMDYPAAARVVHLHLKEFCDESLPYSDMIADSARKAAAALAARHDAGEGLPMKSQDRWAIWRLYPDKPGCPDFLGTVEATGRDDAERIGRERFGCEPSDEVDVQPDDE